jgi:uncharacterized BrkB/YihY/UPF0761 family membrane protein
MVGPVPADDTEPDAARSNAATATPAGDPPSAKGFVAWSRSTATTTQQHAQRLFEQHRDRPLVDLGLRLATRDREAAGTVVGSAIAFRLFLFFVPLVLFIVGIAGFTARWVGRQQVEDAGITGNLAEQINSALSQPTASRWIATLLGLFGVITAGRTLTKVMSVASCLAWRLPVTTKASIRTMGAFVGYILASGLISALVNRIRQDLGLGIASISFVAAVCIYALLWMLLSLLLPRATPDPGAALPGAVLMGVTIAGLQAVSQLYLPDRFDRASELYGAIGAAIVVLGWFFIVGRATILSLVLNAVIYERFGSISRIVFAFPVLRILPRRSERVRRYFGLDDTNGDQSAAAMNDS